MYGVETMKEKIEEFLVFIRYIATKPFKELLVLGDFFKSPDFWMALLAITYFVKLIFFGEPENNKLFVIGIIFCFLWKEYLRGDWKHEWREKREEEMRKKINEARKETNPSQTPFNR